MNLLNTPSRTSRMIATVLVCGLLMLCATGRAFGAAAADVGRSRAIGAYGGSLTKALAAIGAQETSLCIDTPATVEGDTTVPATLGLVFRKGGRIQFGKHKVRINGPIEAGPYRIFAGSGQFSMADNVAAELYVEWWGGSADGATDNTPAFAAAIAAVSKPRIKLLPGTYLGVVAAIDKTVVLQGSGKNTTTLRNNAPTRSTISLSGSGMGTMIADLKVDINGAEETGVLVRRCNYADVERVFIVGQGGKGKFALNISACTLSSFKDIMFLDKNDGHLFVEKSYYSNFRNISSGQAGTMPSMKIVNTASLHFYGIYVEHGHNGSIVIKNAQNVNFYGIGIELAPDTPAKTGFIRVISSEAVNFYGGRVNQYAHKGYPVFDLVGTKGCIIDGWILNRSSRDKSPFIALGTDLNNIQVSNVQFHSNVAATGVSSAAGAKSKVPNLILENLTPGSHPVKHVVNAANLATRNVQGEVKSR
jgi:hypothetical protein